MCTDLSRDDRVSKKVTYRRPKNEGNLGEDLGSNPAEWFLAEILPGLLLLTPKVIPKRHPRQEQYPSFQYRSS